MCGIAGIWRAGGLRAADRESLVRMTEALRHRGPDAGGIWSDPPSGIVLGHRRLAIVDLSLTGAQPMQSHDGRYVTVYNGEIYNFRALRAELCDAGVRFGGTSDTEVMLEAISHWGLSGAVSRFVGMFAFALWDRERRCLSLVRDRLGIKPLHYSQPGGVFQFASELGAIEDGSTMPLCIDRNALARYVRLGYVPAPWTIYTGVRKLEPGCILTLDAAGGTPRLERYWSLEEVAARGRAVPFRGDIADAADELEKLLTDAVRLRMVADVPIGAFLSGGIDSSTVVSMMQSVARGPVRTFSVGFAETEFDEATSACHVAKWLGTEHTSLRVGSAEATGVIQALPEMFDEPFADSSQIPTYLVSKLARQSVTVALSGDGGDEVFGGYNRYLWAPRLQAAAARLPGWFRRGTARALSAIPSERVDDVYSLVEGALPQHLRMRLPGDKFAKSVQVLGQTTLRSAHEELVGSSSALVLVRGAVAGLEHSLLPPTSAWLRGAEQMMAWDSVTYLPDDILTKVDRASMAASLEARVPLLDHRVLAFAWSLPSDYRIQGGIGKVVLRDVLARHVPRRLFERPKMGFGVPIGEWLREDLRPWAEDLLADRRIRADGFLDPGAVRALWRSHLSGDVRNPQRLWTVLMFQAWLSHRSSHSLRPRSVAAL